MSDRQPLDAAGLGELARAAGQAAASAWSALVQTPSSSSAPRCSGAQHGAAPRLACRDDARGACFTLHGGFGGHVAVAFAAAAVPRVASVLLAGTGVHAPLESALEECANILASHAASALAEATAEAMWPSVPEFLDRAAGATLAGRVAAWAESGRLVAECEIHAASGERLCSLLIAPE